MEMQFFRFARNVDGSVRMIPGKSQKLPAPTCRNPVPRRAENYDGGELVCKDCGAIAQNRSGRSARLFLERCGIA